MPDVITAGIAPEQPSRMVITEPRESRGAADSQSVSVREKIALLAHSYWEARGRKGGAAEDDWLRAEREVMQSEEISVQ